MQTIRSVIFSRRSKQLISTLLFVFLFAMIIAYGVSAYRNLFNVDASYYLGATELIYKGKVPIRDFALGYTPLSFYLMLIPRMFMGEMPDYSTYLIINYLFSFLSAGLTGLILYNLTKSKLSSLFAVFLYLLFNYHLEGVFYVLEPFANFFGLLAIYTFLAKPNFFFWILISGFLTGLSFLSKQYGIVYAGTVGLMLLFEKTSLNEKIKSSFVLIVGFFIPISIIFLYFSLVGVEPTEVIKALSGGSYGEKTFSEYLAGITRLFKIFPIIILLPFVFIFANNRTQNKYLIVFIITIVVMTAQFFFQTYLHYYLFILPVLIIAILIGTQSRMKVSNEFIIIWLILSSVFFSYKTFKRTMGLSKSSFRKEIVLNTTEMKPLLDVYKPKSMYCVDIVSVPYYFHLNLEPSMLKEYGYAFGFETTEQVLSRTEDADLVLISKNNFERVLPSVLNILDNNYQLEETSSYKMYFKKNITPNL